MSLRVAVVIALVAIAALAVGAWNLSTQKAQAPTGAPEQGAPPPEPASGGEAAAEPADPGVSWTVPSRWTTDLAQGMRLATYVVPGAKGGEKAECAVYYFGPGQGGGVEANLQRWLGEFHPLEKHDVRKRTPGGIEVTRIEARGTYVAHSMRSGEAQGEKPDWALMGAVVEGPAGDVFFKLTGSRATVDAAAADFDRMLDSMRKK
ncbi:MAG TPA: hypothetical protein VGK89_09255 [Candidatus Eisenbacteria bacterium]|jgi:hypothetical protein